jgi:aryl-alcohol dehydrogenase (NADP+)
VFGWTADERQSFAVLDAYADAGGNFVDTADAYSSWVPGHAGGESETILGSWLARRSDRDRFVIATKVAKKPGLEGLSAKTIRAAAEGSLERLRTDRIDLYYAHTDDSRTPLEETMRAFDDLVHAGKVRHVAASNYTAPRLAEALAVSDRLGLARFAALQPEYNLMQRREYEGPLADLCVSEGLACVPYFALAKGFLTGKYRPGAAVESARARAASSYLDARGLRVLAALDRVAAAHGVAVAAVALAWLLTRPGVVAPIASARTTDQLAELLPMADLRLAPDEIDALTRASD